MAVLTNKDPFGILHEYTRDDHDGNLLSYKNSVGEWRQYTWDVHGNLLSYKDSCGVWSEHTRDAHGKILTYKNSKGDWSEYTRDAHGNVLRFKDHNGYSCENTYDDNGQLLASKDSYGFDGIVIARDAVYKLFVTKEGHLTAGCRYFKTKEEALKHWDRPDERAKIFTEAILKLE